MESSGDFVVKVFWLSWVACFVQTGFHVDQIYTVLGSNPGLSACEIHCTKPNSCPAVASYISSKKLAIGLLFPTVYISI